MTSSWGEVSQVGFQQPGPSPGGERSSASERRVLGHALRGANSLLRLHLCCHMTFKLWELRSTLPFPDESPIPVQHKNDGNYCSCDTSKFPHHPECGLKRRKKGNDICWQHRPLWDTLFPTGSCLDILRKNTYQGKKYKMRIPGGIVIDKMSAQVKISLLLRRRKQYPVPVTMFRKLLEAVDSFLLLIKNKWINKNSSINSICFCYFT